MGDSERMPASHNGDQQLRAHDGLGALVRPQPFRVSGARPLTMTVAFWIAIALAVVSIVNVVVILLTFNWASFAQPAEARTFVSNGRTLTMPSNVSLGVVVAGNILVLVVAVLLGFLAFRLLVGAKRARIVFTVVGGIQVIGFVMSSYLDPTALEVLAAAVFIVLVWLPPSNDFVRRAAAERSNHRAQRLTP